MSNHFLLLLRKDDVLDMYRFGRWKVLSPNIKFSGSIETLASDTLLMKKLFRQANPFDYSMEYFLVHVECPKVSSIEVDDIIDIFALDKDSYKIGLNLSPAIRLGEPIFGKHYIDFQIENEIADARIGIDNIFAIFDLEKPKSFVKKSEVESAIHDSLKDLPIQGGNGLWYYLLRYNRHHPYPADNRGYALDALHVFLNFEKKQDMDVSVIKSKAGQEVINQSPDITYNKLLNVLETQKEFIKRCEKAQKGYYRIAPLFLTLKDIFAEGIHEDKKYKGRDLPTFIESLKKNYDIESLSKALYLLGIVLGRENTYQYIYRKKKLPILKKEEYLKPNN